MNGRPVTFMGVVRVVGWTLLFILAVVTVVGIAVSYHAPPNQECSVPPPGDC